MARKSNNYKAHGELLAKARGAIRAVFGDVSVEPETARSSLEELREDLDELIATLKKG